MKILIPFLFIYAAALAQTGTVKGKITDGTNPVPSVNVYIEKLGRGTGSDEKGNYELRNIPAGEHSIRFSSVGYESVIEKVKVLSDKTTVLNIQMKAVPVEVGTVEVRGIKKQGQDDTRTSVIDLDPHSAKILPGAGEDVLKNAAVPPRCTCSK